jgi:O-antigen/teichoic acid export membrane protein
MQPPDRNGQRPASAPAAPADADADTDADTDASSPISESGQQLIRRAPGGYLWNQVGSLWLFVSLLLFEVVIRRSLPQAQTNVFDMVSTEANLGFYLASLGLTSAGTVYLPRALAENGPGQAMALAIRLVLLRVTMALLVGAAIIWGLPALATLASAADVPAFADLVQSFAVVALIQHRMAIAAYVVGVGASTMLSSLLIALVRTRVVFIFGSLNQLVQLVLAYIFIRVTGQGVDGALVAQALPAAVTACILALVLWRVLNARPNRRGGVFVGPAMKLGVAAWLADLPNSSMVQPVALGQLSAVAPTELLFFKSTYQMGDAGAQFFTSGLGGISMAIMSASYAGRRLASLATGWRTVNKLQVLLAVPLVVFSVPHAAAIMTLLFGSLYSQSGTLLAVFLVLNGLIQILGGSTHEWTLYVLGRQQWVVVSRWGTLVLLVLTGAVLVPHYFALGALLAVGLSRLAAEVFLFVLARRGVRHPYPFAFIGRLLLALVPPAVVTLLWHLDTPIATVAAALTFLPDAVRVAGAQAVTLTIELLIFFAIFFCCLWLVRPLDAEDAKLLAETPRWLRRALAPFINASTGKAAPVAPLSPKRDGKPRAGGPLLPPAHPISPSSTPAAPLAADPPSLPGA